MEVGEARGQVGRRRSVGIEEEEEEIVFVSIHQEMDCNSIFLNSNLLDKRQIHCCFSLIL